MLSPDYFTGANREIALRYTDASSYILEKEHTLEVSLLSPEALQLLLAQTIFVRHASTIYNHEGIGIIQGAKSDPDLSPKGISEVETARGILAHHPIRLIVSSRQQRGLKTANILSEQKQHVYVQATSLLQEIDFGTWEGLRYQDLKDNSEWKAWTQNPGSSDHLPRNGEPFIALQKRVNLASHWLYAALQVLESKHYLVVVSHRISLTAMRSNCLLARNGVTTLDRKTILEFEKLFFYKDELQRDEDIIAMGNAEPYQIDFKTLEHKPLKAA